MQPVRAAALAVVGMHILQPPETAYRAGSGARVFVKTGADVIPGAVGLPAEDDVRSGFHDGIEFLVLAGQLSIQELQGLRPLLSLIHISEPTRLLSISYA